MKVSGPTLGIRFDIDKVNSGDYGGACWRVFWQVADSAALPGAALFEGDTRATLEGRENVYCLAVQMSDAAALTALRSAFEAARGYTDVAASPRFLEGSSLSGEPLPAAGLVGPGGSVSGGFNASYTLEAVRRQRARDAASKPTGSVADTTSANSIPARATDTALESEAPATAGGAASDSAGTKGEPAPGPLPAAPLTWTGEGFGSPNAAAVARLRSEGAAAASWLGLQGELSNSAGSETTGPGRLLRVGMQAGRRRRSTGSLGALPPGLACSCRSE